MGAATGVKPGLAISSGQWVKFFNRIAKGYSISNALQHAKIDRSTAYRYKNNYPDISRRWDQALVDGTEYLEDAARKRAVEGVKHQTGVYYQGVLVGVHTEIKYSDRLLLAMLAARNPAYRFDGGTQVEQRVMQELGKMLDLLHRKLSAEIYQQIIDVLAAGDDTIIDASTIISDTETKAITDSTEPDT